MRPQIVMLIPLGDAPGNVPGYPDNTLPRPDRPVDPGYGRPVGGGGRPDNSLPWGPGRPDNALPMPPVDPSWGVTPPVDPGWGQGHPGNRPDNSLPWGPGRPDNTLPSGGARPDNSLPLPPDSTVPPGSIYPPITQLHTRTAMLAWLPGYGARWIVLGPSATPQD